MSTPQAATLRGTGTIETEYGPVRCELRTHGTGYGDSRIPHVRLFATWTRPGAKAPTYEATSQANLGRMPPRDWADQAAKILTPILLRRPGDHPSQYAQGWRKVPAAFERERDVRDDAKDWAQAAFAAACRALIDCPAFLALYREHVDRLVQNAEAALVEAGEALRLIKDIRATLPAAE